MAVVKTSKKERVAANLRMPVELNQRINEVLNMAKSVQMLSKTDLICEAIERGLDAIEKDLMNASKS